MTYLHQGHALLFLAFELTEMIDDVGLAMPQSDYLYFHRDPPWRATCGTTLCERLANNQNVTLTSHTFEFTRRLEF